MPYRIAIVDDSCADAGLVSELVTDWAHAGSSKPVISVYPSAQAFWFAREEGAHFDLLLLDIEMDGMNGLELARKLRAQGERMQLIFITGYADFMAEGYEVSALHYLMKPLEREKFFETLDRAAQNLKKQPRMILLSVDAATLRLPVEEILYVEAFSHTLRVVTKENVHELRIPLSVMEEQLGEDFVRCHRSYLVGLHAIARISRSEITLDQGQILPLSRSAAAGVHRAFVRYYTET